MEHAGIAEIAGIRNIVMLAVSIFLAVGRMTVRSCRRGRNGPDYTQGALP
jgi:hypothetical protein